jgi:branched-chain amino acid transport system permease protein
MPRIWQFVGLVVLAGAPFVVPSDYYLHLVIQMLIWAMVYTAWSMMGRFGLVSLGHGAFMGIGCYVVALLWNYLGLTPWLGIPIAVGVAILLAVAVGYPCFRFRIVGHYFALVTLALSEVVRLIIIALRDYTGGSLGLTPNRYAEGVSVYAFQFADKATFFYVALAGWVLGLWIWHLVDRSMGRYAMLAIADNDEAAASLGINVTWQKLRITMISAALTAVGGILYGQYQMYLNPNTVSGIAVSLQIVFAVVAGGMFVQLGPTVGAVFTLALAEVLRVLIGNDVPGADTTIYGGLLVLFIIFMPKGILGAIIEAWEKRRAAPAVERPEPAE